MKKIVFIFFCLILAASFACTKSCKDDSGNRKAVLKIGTNANFPPFETIDAQGKLSGFDIDLGREIGKSLGLEVDFKEFDFDALILALNKEQIDIILAGMSITQPRQEAIVMVPYFGEPLTEISLLFWQNVPDEIKSLSDLKRVALEKNLSINLQSGHFFEKVLNDEQIPTKLLPGSPEQILDIKYGKSLAAAIDFSVARKLTQEHPDLKLVSLPLPKDKWDLGNGIGIKKSRTDLIQTIRRVIKEFKADGTLKKLQEKWFKSGQ